MVGPTIKMSFNDTPVLDFAEVLKTTLVLVVVLVSFLLHAWAYKIHAEEASVSQQWALLQHDPE